MANKRIELEQYKSFINLIEEEPNRKMVKRGATIALIISILVALLLLVLGFISVELARNPKNILEKPSQSKKSAIPSVLSDESNDFPVLASEIPTSLGAEENNLIALNQKIKFPSMAPLYQQPGEVKITPQKPQTAPEGKASEETKTEKQKKKKKVLPLQTKGIGNLSNLARSISQRGFQLYLILLTAAIAIIGGIAIGRIRRERKSH